MGRWVFWLLAAMITAAHGAPLDDEFLAAREAYRVGAAARLDAQARRFKGHLLEPYLTYWQLSLRMEQASPEDARGFIASNRDSPLAERVRLEWLRSLGRRGEWDLFNAELPLLAADDLEVTCYALQSRLRVNASEALPEARPLWFIARDLPASCSPLFEALIAAGMLSNDDLWTRIRLALESGQVSFARRVAEWLPAGQAPEPKLLESIASNPTAYLERQKKPFTLKARAERETVMFAVHRLARTVPQHAARQWEKLEPRFSPEERAYVWGMIAYLGAMRHDAEALAWFGKAGDLSDLQLAWKARAALRARSWPDVLAAVNAMTGKESQEPAWRYWKARALRETGRPEQAAEILKPLSASTTSTASSRWRSSAAGLPVRRRATSLPRKSSRR